MEISREPRVERLLHPRQRGEKVAEGRMRGATRRTGAYARARRAFTHVRSPEM